MTALRLATTDLEPQLAEALRAVGRADEPGQGPRLVSASVRVPVVDPIAFYAAAVEAGEEAALLTRPAEGFAIVGIGGAWGVQASGLDRFRVAESAWRTLIRTARLADGPRPAAVGPVLLGGLGFAGREPDPTDPWARFGPSSLVLAGLTVASSPDQTWLTGNMIDGADPSAPGVGAEAARLERSYEHLAARAAALTPGRGGLAARPVEAPLRIVAEQPDAAAWSGLVGLLSGAVGRGRLDKVVLARRVDVVSPVEFDVANALRRLALSSPESTVYAFRRGGSTLLGATPERLVRTEGRRFSSAAIAGTVARGNDPEADAALAAEVLASDKEREEHGVVVATLRDQLEPITTELRISEEPRVLTLRHLQHLVSDVEGTLRERAGLLSLAERIHPTPAVGGEPRDLALALIDEHEGFDRGWYAGPIGWLGADGDGELSVALRCGIVERTKATLFAGCGIVADSDPDREWEESRIKLRAVASALGRPGDGL